MQKLIIHAGLHKTGTSAIQAFLSDNRKWLLDRGFYYPETDPFEAHHRFAAALKSSTSEEEAMSHVAKVLQHYKNLSLGKNVILSSEMFSEGVRPMCLLPAEKFFHSVEIVFYVRTQAELIESAYNQQVKQNAESRKIDEFVPYMINIYEHLKRFAEDLPFALVVAFEYGSAWYVGNGLISDFSHRVLGLDDLSKAVTRSGRVNESLSPVACEVLRRVNARIPVESRRQFVDYLKRVFPHEAYCHYTLLSPNYRVELNAKAARSNEMMKKAFLRSGDLIPADAVSKIYLSEDRFLQEVSKDSGFLSLVSEVNDEVEFGVIVEALLKQGMS